MSIETLEKSAGTVVSERLISVDSHVHFTDDWVKARMTKKMQGLWDEAVKKNAEHNEKVERQGQPQMAMEDFVDLEAAMDPGHFEPNAKLAAMDRDGVEAEVIFPEVGAFALCSPDYMGDDWKEGLGAFNQAMVDFASVAPKRLLAAYQIALYDVDFAVSEVHRLAKAGARCVQVPTFPSDRGLPDVHHPRYVAAVERPERDGPHGAEPPRAAHVDLGHVPPRSDPAKGHHDGPAGGPDGRGDRLLDPDGYAGEVPEAQGHLRRARARLAAVVLRSAR